MARTATARRPKSQPQQQPSPWRHGAFHWNELRTRDAERAKQFYRDTIGWSFERMATPEGGDYWVAMMDGTPVAGMFPLASPQFDGVPESWMSFLAVDDVDARVAKALEAGARLVMPVFDVPDVGRIAMLREPGGAGIGWMTPAGTMTKG
ncbi:MAG: VOC family protein [Hyphomicrobiaceae bacterium]|nr:MAG: VOC family protein [Hyphomicrobiaceae bacterium]